MVALVWNGRVGLGMCGNPGTHKGHPYGVIYLVPHPGLRLYQISHKRDRQLPLVDQRSLIQTIQQQK